MPLTDEDLIAGAKARALAVRALLAGQTTDEINLFVGLEGGFHSTRVEGVLITLLKGWAYVTDGSRESFGASPSIIVPHSIVSSVVDGGRELAEVIDETAGEHDVRSRQGAWGVLSRDLFTRSMSFEVALVAAFAPFYNSERYR
jgi:non-canonical (house-cleaning) NTP pyrophosphatase